MAKRKHEVVRPYAPDFVSAATLAYRLDVSETTRAELEAMGKLPPPVLGLDDLKRWYWPEVETMVRGVRDDTDAPTCSTDDPFLIRVKTRGSTA